MAISIKPEFNWGSKLIPYIPPTPISSFGTISPFWSLSVFNYSAIDLLKMLRNTYAYISKNIKNPSAFKIFIKTERDQNGEIVPKLDIGVGGMYGINFDPQLNSGFILIANWISEVGEL